MRETTASFTRLAMLALAICLFAAAWSHDQQAQSAFILARRAGTAPSVPVAVFSRPSPAARPLAIPDTGQCPIVSRVIIEPPLPEELAPGRYRLIEPSGRILSIIVVESSPDAPTQSSDFSRLELPDGNRQYFIRIGSDEPAVEVKRTASSEIRDALR